MAGEEPHPEIAPLPHSGPEEPLVDARQHAGAQPGAEHRPGGEEQRRCELELPGGSECHDARGADRDDRSERDRVRVALAEPCPQHERGHHDHAAAHAQETRQRAAAEADDHQLGFRHAAICCPV